MRFLSFRRGLLSLRLFDRTLGFFRRGPIRRARLSFAGLGIARRSSRAATAGHGDDAAVVSTGQGATTTREHRSRRGGPSARAAGVPKRGAALPAGASGGRATTSRGERRGWGGSKSPARRRRHASTVSLRGGEALEGRRVLAVSLAGRVTDLDTNSDTGFSTTDNYTNDTTPTFTLNVTGLTFGTGTGVTAERVELVVDGNVVASTAQNLNGPVTGGAISLTAPLLGEGVHTAFFRAVDNAATPGTGAASNTLTFTVDSVAPDLQIVGKPGDGVYTSGTNMAFTATFDEPVFWSGAALPLTIGTVLAGQVGSILQAELATVLNNAPSTANTPSTTITFNHFVGGNDQNDGDGILIGGYQIAGSITNNSNTVTVSDTSALQLGMTVSGGTLLNRTIVNIPNATQFEVSGAAATATNANATLTIGANNLIGTYTDRAGNAVNFTSPGTALPAANSTAAYTAGVTVVNNVVNGVTFFAGIADGANYSWPISTATLVLGNTAFPAGGTVGSVGLADFTLTRNNPTNGTVTNIPLTGVLLSYPIAGVNQYTQFQLAGLEALTDTPGRYRLTFGDLGVAPSTSVEWVKSTPTAGELIVNLSLSPTDATTPRITPVDRVNVRFQDNQGNAVSVTGVDTNVVGAAITQFEIWKDGVLIPWSDPLLATATVTGTGSTYYVSGLDDFTSLDGFYQLVLRDSSNIRTLDGTQLITTYATTWDFKARTTIQSVTPPANKVYKANEIISIQVTYSDFVSYGATAPTLTLNIGGTNRTATAVAGSGTRTLTFNYTVGSAGVDVDLDGIELRSTVGGGVVNDLFGRPAVTLLPSSSASMPNVWALSTTPSAAPSVTSVELGNTNPRISGTATLSRGETLTVRIAGLGNTYHGSSYTVVPVGGTWVVDMNAVAPDAVIITGAQTASTSTSVTVASTAGLKDGMSVSGPGIAPNTVIDSITNATTFELSIAATATSTAPHSTLSFGSTTALAALANPAAYAVTAVVTDAAGNTVSDDYVFNTGTTAPTVDRVVTAVALPVLTGTATLLAGESLSVSVNGATYNDVTVVAGRWSLDLANTAPASGTLAAFTNGVAVNVTARITGSIGYGITDTTAGELTVNRTLALPTVNSLTTSSTLPIITGTATLPTTNSTLRVVVNGNTYSNVPVSGGVWSLDMATVNADAVGVNQPALANALTTGTYSVVASVLDAQGNNPMSDTTSGELVVNTVAPVVLSVNSSTPDGYYRAGQVVVIQVRFSKAVNVDTGVGTPTLTLNTTPARSATYSSGTGTPVLTFTYTVVSGDSSSDLDYSSTTALALNGARIVDAADAQSQNATLTLPAPAAAGSLGANKAIVIDAVAPSAPTVGAMSTNVTPPTITGTIGSASLATGESLTVVVNGATYTNVPVTNGSGGANGTWSLNLATVAPSTGTLGAFANNSTHNVTATVTDLAGNATSDTTTNEIRILTTAPAAPTVVTVNTNQTTPLAADLTLSGTAVLAAGQTLSVAVGGATYTNVPVTAGAWALNLRTATPATGTLALVSGTTYNVVATIADTAGNSASDTTTGELVVNSAVPTVLSVNSSTPDGSYRAGQTIVIQVQLSRAVTVDTTLGSPTLTLSTSPARNATLTGGTANVSVLNFSYTVQVGDTAADLNATAIVLNNATIRDAFGNNLTLTLPASQATGALDTNKAIVVDTTAPSAPTVGAMSTNVTPPTITGTIGSASLATGESLTVVVNGATYTNVPVTNGSGGANGTWSLNLATVAPSTGTLGAFANNSTHNVTATVTDLAGNATSDTTINEIRILTTAPTAVTASADKTYKPGETIQFTVTFNGPVNVTGTPTILGAVDTSTGSRTLTFNYVSGSGTTDLVFRAAVAAGDLDSDGIELGGLITLAGTPVATIANAAGSPVNLAFTPPNTAGIRVDGVAPRASAAITGPIAGTYITGGAGAGGKLTFIVLLDDVVTVTGTPVLTFTTLGALGPNVRQANFVAGSSGTSQLRFEYAVQTGDFADRVTIAANPVSLNGGTIRDAVGNDANLTPIAATTFNGIFINLTTVDSVTLASANGKFYRAGETVLFDVAFTAPVTVTGTPTLPLIVGTTARTANYVSGSGTQTLRFAYAVASGHDDPDGLQFGSTTIALTGGATITNSGGNVQLAFIPPDITGVRVDAVVPWIVPPIVVPAAGNYRLGDVLQFSVSFNESLRVAPQAGNGNVPRIALVVGSNTRHATYVAGTETPALVFDYTIQADDLDMNGIIVSTAISLNGAAITDLAGNATVLTFTPPPTNTVLVDGVAPTVTRFSTSKPNGRYTIGESITIVATMSETVRAGSSVEVTLSTGTLLMLSTATNATTLSGTYVVEAGDNTNDLTISTYTDEGVIDLFGNTLGGTTVPTGGNNIAGSRDIVIDTTAPVITAFTSTTADGFYRVGTPVGGIVITASVSEAVRANSSFSVTLDSGAVVTLSTNTQGTTLTGTYVISSGDNSADLTVTTFNAGSLLDVAGNPFTSFTPPPGTNIADTKALVVDTVAPLPPTAPVEFGSTRLLGGFLNAAEAAAGDLTVRAALGSSGAVAGDRLDLLLGGSPFIAAPKFVALSSQNVTDGFVDFTVTISDLGLDGQKLLTTQITDRAGNVGGVSQALSFTLDRNPPAAPAIALGSGITQAVSRIEATQAPGLVSVSGEPAATFTVTFSRLTTSITKPVAAGASPSIALTSAEVDALGNGLVTVEATQTDQAGNPQAAAPASLTFTLDGTAPTISLSTSTPTLRIGQSATITFTLSEAMTDFNESDVTYSGGQLTAFSGSGTTYTATFTPNPNSTAPGMVSVAAGTFADQAGNPNTAGSLSAAIAIDTIAPTVSVTSSMPSLRSGQQAVISFTLSEASTTFTENDVIVTGGAMSNFTGSGTSYTAVFTPFANSTVAGTFLVADGRFTDAFGNGNISGSLATPIAIDTALPTVTLVSSTAVLRSGQTATITITLSEASTNFTASGVAATGGTLSGFTGSGTAYSAVFTPTPGSTAPGMITVAAGAFTDAFGNPNVGGSLATAIAIDTVVPTISITSSAASLRSGQSAMITFALSESSSNFGLGSVTVTGGTLSNFAGSGTAYTATFTPSPNSTSQGTIAVAAGAFTDGFGNPNVAGTLVQPIAIDTVAPNFLTIASSASALGAGQTATIAFTLNEPTTTFTLDDIVATGGTLSGFTGSGTAYSVTFTPTPNSTSPGTVSVPAGGFTDLAGNPNPVANLSPAITIDTSAPFVTSFTTTSPNRVYAIGETVSIVASLSEEVQSGGTVNVRLDTGAVVTLTSLGTASATGAYVIRPGQVTGALNVVSILPTGTMRDGAGNALVSTSLPATTNNLAGRHTIVVDGAVKVLTVSGFSTDPSNVAAIRSPVVRVPIVFSTPVSGVTLDAFRLLLNGRSVSLRGAQVTGSGTSYELILPSRRANPRGIYTLEVRNDTGISAELNGAQMTEPAAFYWGRSQSVGTTRNARLRAFASLR